MSFLSELAAKKAKLKPTITLETRVDGTQRRINTADGTCLETISQAASTSQYGFVVDTKPDLMPACILDDFLYLGSQDAVNEGNVLQYRFSDIISIGIETPPFVQPANVDPVHLHFIPCLDLPETDLKPMADAAISIIEAAKRRLPPGRVLIHCNAGVSRSAAVCIAYLMLMEKNSFQAAYQLVKARRECIRPNDGFMRQLKAFEA